MTMILICVASSRPMERGSMAMRGRQPVNQATAQLWKADGLSVISGFSDIMSCFS